MVPVWEEHLETVRKAGSSTGAIVAVEATGAPAGWGAPVYGKLDAELAGALMSINAAKGVEIGAGFAAAALSGEENADEMRAGNDGPVFLSKQRRRRPGRDLHRPADHRAGRLQAHVLDPVSPAAASIEAGEEIELRTKGRHDPLRRHPRRAGGGGHGRLRARRRLPARPRPDRARLTLCQGGAGGPFGRVASDSRHTPDLHSIFKATQDVS